MNSVALEILLVEDNPGDARLTLEAFKEGKVLNHLTVIGDGAASSPLVAGGRGIKNRWPSGETAYG